MPDPLNADDITRADLIRKHDRRTACAAAYSELRLMGYLPDYPSLLCIADKCMASHGTFAAYWQRIVAYYVNHPDAR